MVNSLQTLSESDRRLVAAWAADCAERVLWIFETERPTDERPRAAIARTRAYSRGELDTAAEIRQRFKGGGAFKEVKSPAAAAAARAAGQASAICHIGGTRIGCRRIRRQGRQPGLCHATGDSRKRDSLAAHAHDAERADCAWYITAGGRRPFRPPRARAPGLRPTRPDNQGPSSRPRRNQAKRLGPSR